MAAKSWNKVELMGNLTRDPELRYTPNGAAVCTFGLATNRSYVSDGERKEEVDFHNLVAWNKLAELCNSLLKKGSRVFLSGRLQYREWEGQDNVKRRVAEIVVEDMIQLTPKSEMGGASENYSQMADTAGLNTPASQVEPAPSTTSPVPAKTTVPTDTPAPTTVSTPTDDTSTPPKVDETINSDDLPF